MNRSGNWADGVPSSQLGEINNLPGLGRRYIDLWRFEREGLGALYRTAASGMFTNRRLNGPHRHGIYDAEGSCEVCKRSFNEICGDDTRNLPELHQLVTVKSRDGRTQKVFCWDCAASRETLIEACGPAFASCIAEDGQDVFALIAQIIYEDRLADQPDYQQLKCHHTVRVHPTFKNQIDGRLRTVQKRLQRQ